MKRKRLASVLGASALTFGTMLAPAMPVFAATSYTGVSGSSVSIQKYLVMDSNAAVPNVTFNFSIVGEGKDDLNVYSGADTSKVTGSPVIGTATFTNESTKYSSVQNLESTGIQAVEGKKDPVTLEAGQSYARANVSVNFSGVTFKEPGIYGYKITENADNTGTITNDAKTARYMYVYVEDDGSGNLSVKGYVLYGNPIKSTDGDSGEWIQGNNGEFWYQTDETKSEGFVNTMNGKGLSITKQVSGNQASHDEYFKFTLNIAHALPNTTYSVDLSKADVTTRVTGVNADTHENAATITTNGDGNASVEYWLQAGQSVSVNSLSIGTTYTVSEDKAVMEHEGYTTAITNADDTDGVTNDEFTTNGSVDKADTKIDISFTNKKSGTIPTGVVMAVAPFAVATLFGGAGAATIVMKKRKANVKEDENE